MGAEGHILDSGNLGAAWDDPGIRDLFRQLVGAIQALDGAGRLVPMSAEPEAWRVTARPPKGRDGANWQLRYFPPPTKGRPGREGQPYQRSAGTRDPDRARELAEAEERRLNGDSLPLSAVLEQHAAWRELDPDTRPMTVRNYRSAARRWLRYFAGQEVTRASLETARDAARADGIAASTINVDLAMIGHAWTWARERGLVDRDWPRIRRLRERDTRKRPCTPEETRAILEALATHAGGRHFPLFALLSEAGSRAGETLQLREQDIDRERGRVRFRAETTKAKTERIAHVAPEVLALIPEQAPTGYLFPGSRPGKPLHATSAGLAWRRALALCGLEGQPLDPHSLRRAWITDAFEAGGSLPHIMRQVGHRDPATTLRYQRQATEQDLAGTAARVRDYRATHDPHTTPPHLWGGGATMPETQEDSGQESSSRRQEEANQKPRKAPRGCNLRATEEPPSPPHWRSLERLVALAARGERSRKALLELCADEALRAALIRCLTE